VSAPTDTEIDEAAARGGARRGPAGAAGFLVASPVERPRASWPGCCNSGCEPCMDALTAAALEARAALGLAPER